MNHLLKFLLLAVLTFPAVTVAQASPARASTPCRYSSALTISRAEYAELRPGVTTFAAARTIIGSPGTGSKIERPVESLTRTWRRCAPNTAWTMDFRREAGKGIVLQDIPPFAP